MNLLSDYCVGIESPALLFYNFEILYNYRTLEKLLDLLRVPVQDHRSRSKAKHPSWHSAQTKDQGKRRTSQTHLPREQTMRSIPRTNASDKPSPRPLHQTDHHTQRRNPTESLGAPREGPTTSTRNFCSKKKKKNRPHPPRVNLYSHIKLPSPLSEHTFCMCEEEFSKASSFLFLFVMILAP